MKNVIWVRITKSLCAVFLIFSLLVCAYPRMMILAAEDEPSNETLPTAGVPASDGYRYLLEIEYSGTFTFIYDWGVWDPDKCMYVASQESKYPAADTTDGMPGWYGFDGVTNKITFTNYSAPRENESLESSSLYVRLDYHTNSWIENGEQKDFPNINPITIEYYRDWNEPTEFPPYSASEQEGYLESDSYGENGCIVKIPYKGFNSDGENAIYSTTDVYFSLSGAPYVKDTNEMYHASTPTAIGFIKITVGNSPNDLIPQTTTN